MKQFDRTRENLTDSYYQKGNFNTPFSETNKADMEEYVILNNTIMKFELIHKHMYITSLGPPDIGHILFSIPFETFTQLEQKASIKVTLNF